MEALAYLVFALLEFVALFTAQALIHLFSRGRWQSEGIHSDRHRIHSGAGALSYRIGGRRVITTAGQSVIGFAFYFAAVSLAIYWLS
ncbi:Uncharacterised protein [Delftia tsuruhatensis]|uniref:hypothetical protein n=1 Tax=Delftia tsuruhatensis TaxID=180282 RepID=UPI001E7C298B|nr:hypothetical protein [Delftia tsuruhatensis]CAB5718226.1 Uncharacterised protein [Delftia tsuruhatensis]CAC9692412.1 Uncharacterised protein [Delftia tsuruhatensis]